jgi:hypothetical protein
MRCVRRLYIDILTRVIIVIIYWEDEATRRLVAIPVPSRLHSHTLTSFCFVLMHFSWYRS